MVSRIIVVIFQIAIAIILPLVLIKILNPALLETTNPHDLGCCGPFPGLGLISGILLVLQLRLKLYLSSKSLALPDPVRWAKLLGLQVMMPSVSTSGDDIAH